jgi:hypothetical protein
MNLKKLRAAIVHYDSHKGILRRLFGDATSIVALKQFILTLNTANDETREIKFSEFMKYKKDNNFNFQFTSKYLNSNSLSSNIFKTWKNEIIKLTTLSIKTNPVKFDYSKLIEDYFLRETKLPQIQPVDVGEIQRMLDKSSSDTVREAMRNEMDEAILESSNEMEKLRNSRPIGCYISTSYSVFPNPDYLKPKPSLYDDRPDGFVMVGKSM